MSNVTRLPLFAKTVHVEAETPVSQRDEFERAMVDIVAGARPRRHVRKCAAFHSTYLTNQCGSQ